MEQLKFYYSKMFEDLKKAVKFGKTKKDYIIFRLIKHKNYSDYEWGILENEKYKIYLSLLNIYKKHKKKLDYFMRFRNKNTYIAL